MTSAPAEAPAAYRRPPTNSQARLTMVEPARRHGPFDTRYPVRPKLAATAWELQTDEVGLARLDWSAFLARFFPNRRRHDFEALAAYASYRNALEQASRPAAPVASRAHQSDTGTPKAERRSVRSTSSRKPDLAAPSPDLLD